MGVLDQRVLLQRAESWELHQACLARERLVLVGEEVELVGVLLLEGAGAYLALEGFRFPLATSLLSRQRNEDLVVLFEGFFPRFSGGVRVARHSLELFDQKMIFFTLLISRRLR